MTAVGIATRLRTGITVSSSTPLPKPRARRRRSRRSARWAAGRIPAFPSGYSAYSTARIQAPYAAQASGATAVTKSPVARQGSDVTTVYATFTDADQPGVHKTRLEQFRALWKRALKCSQQVAA